MADKNQFRVTYRLPRQGQKTLDFYHYSTGIETDVVQAASRAICLADRSEEEHEILKLERVE